MMTGVAAPVRCAGHLPSLRKDGKLAMGFPTDGFEPVSAVYTVQAVAPQNAGAMIIRLEYVVADQDVFSGDAPVDLGDSALAAGAEAITNFLESNGWTGGAVDRTYNGVLTESGLSSS